MMHPDHWDFIVAMARAFVITTVVIYAFKLGHGVAQMLYGNP